MSFITSIPGFFGKVELPRDETIVEPGVFCFVSVWVMCPCTIVIFVVLEIMQLVSLSFH